METKAERSRKTQHVRQDLWKENGVTFHIKASSSQLEKNAGFKLQKIWVATTKNMRFVQNLIKDKRENKSITMNVKRDRR